MFYFDSINGKKILKSDFVKDADAFFTTKDVCICDKSDDADSEIINNKKIIANYLGIELENFISPTQTHSSNVQTVTDGIFDYPDTDALILTDRDKAIFLNFADCTPIIFYDMKQNIGAVSHAGWRGTAQKIAPKTAQKLFCEFNSNKNDIIVLIGPAICKNCYQVGDDVFLKLRNTVDDSKFIDNLYAKSRNVDLKEINRKQLTELGINKIDVCPYCTCCENEYFYSYRKENGTTLRHSAVLKLKNCKVL